MDLHGMRLLTPSDYRTMPWKNGHGTTHEIAAERTEDDLRTGQFVWRLSIAEVGASAPFSTFPGCDRTIVLLAGDGMLLDSGPSGRHVLNQRFTPYAFKGEWQTDCRLLGGPCRDFNVMVDRTRAQALVSVLPMSAESQRLTTDGQALVLFSLSGTILVTPDSSASTYELPAHHTLILSTESEQPATQGLVLCANEPVASALLIRIDRRGPSAEQTLQ
jgi:environmental stress-induced protein Ves